MRRALGRLVVLAILTTTSIWANSEWVDDSVKPHVMEMTRAFVQPIIVDKITYDYHFTAFKGLVAEANGGCIPLHRLARIHSELKTHIMEIMLAKFPEDPTTAIAISTWIADGLPLAVKLYNHGLIKNSDGDCPDKDRAKTELSQIDALMASVKGVQNDG